MTAPPFRVKALYDYSSKETDDLNFPNGQIITVTDVEDDDWYFGEYKDAASNKQEGLFPKNFVQNYEPEMPPRPSRTSKSKKELESLAPTDAAGQGLGIEEPEASSSRDAPVTAPAAQPEVVEQAQEVSQQLHTQESKPEPPPAAAPSQKLASKPAAPMGTKPAPPPATEKPSSGSFRDRINAFNKSAAPPVAPMKPSGLGTSSGSGFVKKAFVAPPPSKNAYVPPPRDQPPQRVYKREEDPEVMAQIPRDIPQEEQANQQEIGNSVEEEEDLPKPTSLKDRIALLQKQQMEQAARHAESGQKKEKPKRPTKRHVEPEEHLADEGDDFEGEKSGQMNSDDAAGKLSMDSSREASAPAPRPSNRPRKSREATPVGSPVAVASRDLLSDPNDADQSGVGDTEEGEELSTGRDDSDEKPSHKAFVPSLKPSQMTVREADVGDEEENAEEDGAAEENDEEEEEVDPEVKRRMEIRERMAKMSGGMGMAGMFGPPGGLPPKSSVKQASASNDRKASASSTSGQTDSPASRAPPVPMMPMPGLQKVQSPEQSESQPEVSKQEANPPSNTFQRREPEEMPDVEDLVEDPLPPSRKSTERPAPPQIPQDRPVPAPFVQGRAPPPMPPTERSVPPPPSELRPVPQPPLSQPLSPSEGSESDDEMSLHTRSSLRLPPENDSRPTSRGDPPAMPSLVAPSALPSRPAPQSRSSDYGRPPEGSPTEMSPTISAAPNRSSRVPPVPGSSPAMSSLPQNRPPPPPPPTSNAPPTRMPAGEGRILPTSPALANRRDLEDSEEEITEYEGDYDTDIASGATHKDALKSQARASSVEDDSNVDAASYNPSNLPASGPATNAAPRVLPPPPPNQPPRHTRQSSDMPRAAPPPPPPPKEQAPEEDEEDYDPYKYTKPGRRQESAYDMEDPVTPRLENTDAMMSVSPPQRNLPPIPPPSQSQYATSSSMAVPSRTSAGARQSMDVPRASATIRRSTDGPRPSGEHGFIATDIDLGYNSLWWARPNIPPPVFQNRRDLVFETEETSTTRRGGKQEITKTLYVLFMDYSQTVVTVRFEAREPADASLEQRHEPPPQGLRQDQLENAHTRFGSQIAQDAAPKEGSVVGDGSPNAFVLNLLSSLPDALLPVGLRAYGALVYANLANASVRQFDEIRPGDIITFRNAKFQGHRGAMHSKYSNEVGKPDHVGVVIDWDGTKKKVRAWEQGRESKKVKSESFKLGDMRSGEVKVWRVMARSWVGWEGQN